MFSARNYLRDFQSTLGRRKTVRAHVWQSIATYGQQGMGLVLGVILARILTPQDFGEYGFAFATVSLVLLPVSWNISALLLADAGRTPRLIAEVMSFAWLFAGLKILLTLILVATLWAIDRPTTASLAGLIGLAQAMRDPIYVPMYDLQGRGEFKYNAYAEAIVFPLCFLTAIPAGLAHWGPFALVLPGFVGLFGYLIMFSRAGRHIPWPRIDPRNVFAHMSHGFWLWLNGIAEVAYSKIDTWFIGRNMGMSALGFYTRAYNYGPVALLVLNSLMRNPTMVAFSRAKTWAETRRLLAKTTIFLSVGGVLNFLGLFYLADPLVVWVFGEQWRPAIPLFRALAGFSLSSALFWIPLNLLFAHRRYRAVAVVRILGGAMLVAILFGFASSMTLERICWLVQLLLLAQGAVLWPIGVLAAKKAFFQEIFPQVAEEQREAKRCN